VVIYDPGELAIVEMRTRLAPLTRAIEWEVDRRVADTRASGPLSSIAVTEQHARTLLETARAFTEGGPPHGPGLALVEAERNVLARLALHANRNGVTLPCTRLREHGLDDLDIEVLLVIAAPCLDASFGSLFAYLQDSFEATAPGAQLATRLVATSPAQERLVREACGPFGKLRSTGLVEMTPPDRIAGPLLRPADGVTELLTGSAVDLDLLGLPRVSRPSGALPPGITAADIAALADALAGGLVEVVGLWGASRSGVDAVLAALCDGAESVRVSAIDAARGLQRAAIARTICVIDVGDETDEEQLEVVLAMSRTPTVLVGREPVRVPAVWSARPMAELHAREPTRAELRDAWTEAFPRLPEPEAGDLATRFALAPDDVAAVASLDRAASSWAFNGSRPSVGQLAARVSRHRSMRLAAVFTPRRGRDLLVLPAAEERKVFQVAEDFRAWPRVAERWRLDRFGHAGITALFAGEPGTGKTLAAEVIAAEIGLDLMVVDLSLLVSKWIGETEKNLDAVFTEAGRSHCVLFFDEADTIYGRRGEISRGADRYANLEVGYLLQRLDRYEGLVVLATNLRDQLDEAFTRRFQHLVHFPNPGPAERRRMWELVLAPPVALDGPVDLDALTALELTGAAIAAIVRSAALAVHHANRSSLRMADLREAAARQYQREARLVPRDLVG
jgi:hypothetical protein